MKPETLLGHIERTRATIASLEEAVVRRKKKVSNVRSRVKKGKLTEKEKWLLKNENKRGRSAEKILTELYSEELISYEERLIGMKGRLEEYVNRALFMGLDVQQPETSKENQI